MMEINLYSFVVKNKKGRTLMIRRAPSNDKFERQRPLSNEKSTGIQLKPATDSQKEALAEVPFEETLAGFFYNENKRCNGS